MIYDLVRNRVVATLCVDVIEMAGINNCTYRPRMTRMLLVTLVIDLLELWVLWVKSGQLCDTSGSGRRRCALSGATTSTVLHLRHLRMVSGSALGSTQHDHLLPHTTFLISIASCSYLGTVSLQSNDPGAINVLRGNNRDVLA